MNNTSIKIEKEQAKIYTKYLLYEKSIDEIKAMLENKDLSYRFLLSSIYELLEHNKMYFLINNDATSKVRSIIGLKRYDNNIKSLNDEFNSMIIKANEIDASKNKEKHIRNFANYDLNIRTLDPRYSKKKSKKEKLEDLKLLLLELQAFDYEYIRMIKYEGYDSINEYNYPSFISSTNYLLNVVPEIFLCNSNKIISMNGNDSALALDMIISIIEKYKDYDIKASEKTLKKLR